MGLLDDAIRQHLELKRRHGADPDEVSRQEREALGPVRREELEVPDHAAAEVDVPPAGPVEPLAPGTRLPEAAGGAVAAGALDDEDPYAGLGPDTSEAPLDNPEGVGPPPHPLSNTKAGDPLQAPSLPVVPTGEEPVAPGADDHMTQSPAPAPSAGLPDVDDDLDFDFGEPGASLDPEPEPLAGDEDVLDQTPEFLQETPEHDRLWFEQKPPRDFDFE